MRVISLVPSLTETLIECGINVVGRTRFCIHPDRVRSIPVVGGTKDLNWDSLKALKADLLILDKEENLPWMKQEAPCAVHVCHARDVEGMAQEFHSLSKALYSEELVSIAKRWTKIQTSSNLTWDWQNIPAQLQGISRQHRTYEKLVYVIWKNPWMRVSAQTFIGSVLKKLGAGDFLDVAPDKYPQFEMDQYDREKTFFLFSSEPFPFAKQPASLKELNVEGAVVDGESYSWFGVRSLVFLETQLVLKMNQ